MDGVDPRVVVEEAIDEEELVVELEVTKVEVESVDFDWLEVADGDEDVMPEVEERALFVEDF